MPTIIVKINSIEN